MWKKLEKSLGVLRQCELKQQLPFYHLHSSSTQTTQNLRWKKKKCYSTSLLTSPDQSLLSSLCTLGVMGKGESKINREGEKERWMGWERQPVTERKIDWDEEQKWREGEDWNNRKHKELEANFLWFPPVSNFSSLCKSACRFGYLILIVWPAQMSQLLFQEINLELIGFNFYNDRLVAFDISGSCSSKPSTKSRVQQLGGFRNTLMDD